MEILKGFETVKIRVFHESAEEKKKDKKKKEKRKLFLKQAEKKTSELWQHVHSGEIAWFCPFEFVNKTCPEEKPEKNPFLQNFWQ